MADSLRLSKTGFTNTRALASRLLCQVLTEGRSLSDALISAQDIQDKSLLQELCFGTLRWYSRLDAIASELLNRSLRRKDRDIHLLILLGLYQLEYLRVPAHAALTETVEATRVLGKPWASGLVNGVLRQYQRQRERLLAKADDRDETRYAFPAWLIARLRQAWPNRWRQILEASNHRPPMSLRVNSRQLSRDEYLARLSTEGIVAQAIAHTLQGIVLENPVPVERLNGFSQGLVSVQDGGAQLAAPLLEIAGQDRILDACAAPGGKSCHILESTPDIASLTAVDIDERRLRRIEENLVRLRLSARLRPGNAAAPAGDWAQLRYQRILLDVPCSATGVIRRHPDIKWLRRDQDIAELQRLQAQILDAMWPLLTPGGLLLYATCSLLPEENENQIHGFLARTPDASEKPIDVVWGHARRHGRQTLPGEPNMDGFFYARLEKAC